MRFWRNRRCRIQVTKWYCSWLFFWQCVCNW